ncbi:MAG: HNH endonuclease [Chloroflexi bacterium]|nr:HNH endonuclease [Chloroflexota bacterium]
MKKYISVELRRFVFDRAKGQCEYCLIHDDDGLWPHEIDHIYAEKHGGETIESNLCLSCDACNRYKGSDLASLDPESSEPVFLFHPRRDVWSDHFRLNDSIIEPLTPKGRATDRLLKLNLQERLDERTILIEIGRYPTPS